MAKILIVEDNESLNQVYKFILEQEGHQVSAVFNGAEALKAAKGMEPDLILLDMLMPVMGGIEFLKKFNPSKHPATSILILSNLDEDQETKEAQKLGASDYILKATVSPTELAKRINSMLGA